jgi:hypothetical protein
MMAVTPKNDRYYFFKFLLEEREGLAYCSGH